MTTPQQQVQALKDEGNSLFSCKKYGPASVKYSEALRIDDNNAVLYANRAACRLAVGQYLDAAVDAKRATQIDPLYSKAWARLASAHDALSDFLDSIHAWERALDTLPKENLSSTEAKQRVQYEEGLKNAHAAKSAAVTEPTRRGIPVSRLNGKMPWTIAEEMLPELRAAQNIASSAWVIWAAYEDFKKGTTAMKSFKTVQRPEGAAMHGSSDGIESLTNAIMRDTRVFHISDPNWVEMYNKQVMLECTSKKAWPEGGPESVIQECQKRLRTGGWKDVRPAVTTTIRCWIMRGFIEGGLRGRFDTAVEFYSRAIEVINWGRVAWKNVSVEQRGVIFETSFLRGIRAMHLEALMQAYSNDPGSHSRFPLEKLLSEADDLLKDESANASNKTLDPGFMYSFFIYPKAHALSMKGFYHVQIASLEGGLSVGNTHIKQAISYYAEAASLYPEDDEQYPWFLNCALNNMFRHGTSLGEILLVMEKIRVSVPKMKKIWSNSSVAKQGGHASLDKTIMVQKDLMEKVQKGQLTFDKILTVADVPLFYSK